MLLYQKLYIEKKNIRFSQILDGVQFCQVNTFNRWRFLSNVNIRIRHQNS